MLKMKSHQWNDAFFSGTSRWLLHMIYHFNYLEMSTKKVAFVHLEDTAHVISSFCWHAEGKGTTV